MDTIYSTYEDAIRMEAFLLSEQAGHPAGMETTFWIEAERLVTSRAGRTKTTSSAPEKVPTRQPRRRKSAATAPDRTVATAIGRTPGTRSAVKKGTVKPSDPDARKTSVREKKSAVLVKTAGEGTSEVKPTPAVKRRRSTTAGDNRAKP